MANGGTVTIKNPLGVSLAVSVTPVSGTVAFLKSAGGTASFPETITTDETFACTSDCAVSVSVKYAGTEIAGEPDGAVTTELRNGVNLIIQPSPSLGWEFFAPVSTTTAALVAIGNAINTTGKYAGKQVWNATTTKPNYAADGTAGGVWKDATGATAHTPA